MASFQEDQEFRVALKGTDWISLYGSEPTRSEYRDFKKNLRAFYENEEKPCFEAYFAYLRKILPATSKDRHQSFHIEFQDFTQHETSDAWQRFCTTFYRQPTFVDYADFVSSRECANWSQYQCQVPTFGIYLQFLIERDNVPFDWNQVCGHTPSLLEFMVYLVGIAHVDWNSMGMEKPSFRQVMEQGQDKDESFVDQSMDESIASAANSEAKGTTDNDDVDGFKSESIDENVAKRTDAPSPETIKDNEEIRETIKEEDEKKKPDEEIIQEENEETNVKEENVKEKEELEEGEIEDGEIVDEPSPSESESNEDDKEEKEKEEDTTGKQWCNQCGVLYNIDEEQEHRLLYHEPKTSVYRCAECGWDHASYALLQKHYDSRHPRILPTARPITRHSRVSVPAIIILPQCKKCGYGSLIPFANSYHNCEGLPRLIEGGQELLIYKERQCPHVERGGPLCARCDSYFSPPLAQVSYRDGRFRISITEEVVIQEPTVPEVMTTDSEGESEPELQINENVTPPQRFVSDITELQQAKSSIDAQLEEENLQAKTDQQQSVDNEEYQPLEGRPSPDTTANQDSRQDPAALNINKTEEVDDLLAETFAVSTTSEGVQPAEQSVYRPADHILNRSMEDIEVSGQTNTESTDETKNDMNPEAKPTVAVASSNDKKFTCKDCDFTFSLYSNLAHHRYAKHTIKDRVFRCRQCGHDIVKYNFLKKHYETCHPGVRMPEKDHVHVYAKPYILVPKCEKCGYESCIPHAIKYHQCASRAILTSGELRISCPNLCTHTNGRGDFCGDCLRTFAPTERRVKYDCLKEQFVISVREKFVKEGEEQSDDDAEGAEHGSLSDSSDGERPDTSDESDENAETRALRESFFQQQTHSASGLQLLECRFCGKKKAKRTLIMHIKKYHCTKFSLIRCHLCGCDTVTYQDMRKHWRNKHSIYDGFRPRADVHFVSEPYQQIKRCSKCMYQSLIPYAVQMHSCDTLPILKNNELHIERVLKCEHSQDIKYSYGLGAASKVCADCVHMFVPNQEAVKYEAGFFKIAVKDQKLARDDPQYQAQQAAKDTGKYGNGNITSNPLPGLTVNKRRLLNRSCTDLVTGIELRERYFCAAHAEEYASARAQVEHNFEMHPKQAIMETYRCYVCSYDGQNFYNIKKHVLQYHKEDCIDNTLFIVKVSVPGFPKVPMCKHCNFASMDAELFRTHDCYFWTKRTAPRQEDGQFHCPECNAGFRIEQHMWQHKVDEHTKRRYIYRCFVCGYDSESFTLIYKHIDENHPKRKRGQILKEHCIMAVEEKQGRILRCKKCGYASLIQKCIKGHKCGQWPEKLFQMYVPKHQKPGRYALPDLSPNKKNILGLNGLPPFPKSWKFRDLTNSADRSKMAAKAASSQAKHPINKPSQNQRKPGEKRSHSKPTERYDKSKRARRDVATNERVLVRRDSKDSNSSMTSRQHPSTSYSRAGSSDGGSVSEMMQSDVGETIVGEAWSGLDRDDEMTEEQAQAWAAAAMAMGAQNSQRATGSYDDASGDEDYSIEAYTVKGKKSKGANEQRHRDNFGNQLDDDSIESHENLYNVERNIFYANEPSISGKMKSKRSLNYVNSQQSNYQQQQLMYPSLPLRYPMHPGDTSSMFINGGSSANNSFNYPFAPQFTVAMPDSGKTSMPSPLAAPATSGDSITLPPSAENSKRTIVESDTKCGHCMAMFPTAKAKEDHVYDQHENKTKVFRCPMCYFDATLLPNLKKHVKQRHRGVKVELNEAKTKVNVPSFMFVPLCSRGCGYSSLSAHSMQYHRCSQG